MTTKHLPFRFLTGDVNWDDHGGTWIAGPLDACSNAVGGYTYFFVLEWAPHEENGVRGFVTLNIVIPSMWNAWILRNTLEDCELEGLTLEELLSRQHSVGHQIYVATIDECTRRAPSMREAKILATQASTLLGFRLDAGGGWDWVRGDSPIVPPAKYNYREQAELGIILALLGDEEVGAILDEIDLGLGRAVETYRVLERASQYWLERWFASNMKNYKKRRR